MDNQRFALAIFCMFSLMALSMPLQAQIIPGDRDLIRERQERLLEEQRRRIQELQNLPGREAPSVTPQPPVVDEQCFTIRHIELQGADILTPRRSRELLAPYLNRCLGANALNELLKSITDYYLQCGYITSRAYLPQQDLTSGQLRIVVVEGRIEGMDSSRVVSDRELFMAFPSRQGDRLNLRALEQLVDQMGRLPSRRTEIELLPGNELGGSRVTLKGEREKPWRVRLGYNNDGQRSTGEQQWGAGLEWDSPLGLGDYLSLNAGGDTITDHWRNSSNQSLYYSLPWGWWTFSYNYSQSYYRTKTQGDGFDFVMDGTSKSHLFHAERVIHRNDVGKTAINAGLSRLETRNYIDDERLDISSHRITELQLGINHGRRIGSAFLNADLGWQSGIGALDAQRKGHPGHGVPNARYNKYSLTLSYYQPFTLLGQNLTFESLANGQWSDDVLFSPQRISLGGQPSIRGYKDQSMAGDSGGYWRNQIRWRQPVTWKMLQPIAQEYGVVAAYDIGVIRNDRYSYGQNGRMTGNAFEFYARGKYLTASVVFARSLEKPGFIEKHEHPIYFRLDLFI